MTPTFQLAGYRAALIPGSLSVHLDHSGERAVVIARQATGREKIVAGPLPAEEANGLAAEINLRSFAASKAGRL